MGPLGGHLVSTIPSITASELHEEWDALSTAIQSDGLEAALLKHEAHEGIESAIRKATADFILKQELPIIADVVSGVRKLRFSRLLNFLVKNPDGIPVITTNYDRLIEIACETVGIAVDTMFDGAVIGTHNPPVSRRAHLTDIRMVGTSVRRRYREHIRLMKPHGSLDWFEGPSGPLRCSIPIDRERLLITPGRRKYRQGYDLPFDKQREEMNRHISEGARLLILGYGFNDDHLETHLTAKIQQGTPTLILTHKLSTKALTLARENPAVIALDCAEDAGTRMLYRTEEYILPDISIWDLDAFIREVME